MVKVRDRQKHHKPIINTERGRCFLCEKLNGDYSYKPTHEHHVLYGSGKRRNSEGEGLKVYLCLEHHTAGPKAVHNSREARKLLCRIFQAEYEKTHTHEEWMQIAGKNYLRKEQT